MEYNFKAKDNYSVNASSILSTQDRKIMSVLYLPIIGVEATMLYFVLWSDLEGDSVMSKILRPFSRLTNVLDISINKLNAASDKLEGVGLIQTYCKDGNYILVLKSPKTANAFFKNDLLRSMLKNKIGEEEYDRSKMYFAYKQSIPSGYINVSKSFQDVFSYPDFTESENDELVERNEAKVVLNYNFDQLYSGLVNVSKYAFTDKVKEAIGNIMFCYNISLVDMRSIIMKAYNLKDLSIDIDKIRFFAQNHYRDNNVSLTKKENGNPKFTGEESIDQFINACESMTPFEFLTYKDGRQPIGPDLELLTELRNNFDLPNSVLNVIIDYALKRNDNILAKAYVLKLASTLQRSKIDNAYDAMMKLKYPKFKKPISKVIKDESIPETDNGDENIDDLLAKIDRGEF